jgi:hypothetical protein
MQLTKVRNLPTSLLVSGFAGALVLVVGGLVPLPVVLIRPLRVVVEPGPRPSVIIAGAAGVLVSVASIVVATYQR